MFKKQEIYRSLFSQLFYLSFVAFLIPPNNLSNHLHHFGYLILQVDKIYEYEGNLTNVQPGTKLGFYQMLLLRVRCKFNPN